MVITAKFSSVCPACNEQITVGEKVVWRRGTKAKHTACVAQSSAPVSQSAVTSTSRELIARFRSRCEACSVAIEVGDAIVKAAGQKSVHKDCNQAAAREESKQASEMEVVIAKRERAYADNEVAKGQRDVENWRANKAMFGNDVAEQMEIERELREGETFDW